MKITGYILLIFSFSLFHVQAQRRSLQNKSTTVQPNISSSKPTTKNAQSNNIQKARPTVSKTSPAKVGEGYWALGINAHTNASFLGGFSLRKAWGKNPQNISFIGLDIVKTEDYREFNLLDASSNISIRDGKINHLFTLRPEFGKEIMLLKKGPEGGTQLKGILAAGPSIGLVTPYYVNVTSRASGFNSSDPLKMEEFYSSKNPITQYIIGESGMFKGLSESKIQPGLHGKIGLLMEFSSVKRNYLGIEIGFVADGYFKPIQLMYGPNEARSAFSSAYLTFYIGKK